MIGAQPQLMRNVAVRLLTMKPEDIAKTVSEICAARISTAFASLTIDKVSADQSELISRLQSSLVNELAELGLIIVNARFKSIEQQQ